MTTCEDDSRTKPCPDSEPEEQDPGFLTPAPLSEDALIERMESVVLKSEENHDRIVDDDDGNKDVGGCENSGLLPLRPYAGDCPHYVRTGTCKFGLNCRYNHPVKKTQQFLKSRDSDSDNFGTIECKYFSTAGGCKYGKSCRYGHPGEESENSVPELNFLGLPMRLGEKECPYYMRNGSCGYGSRCVYHHPEPTSVAGKRSPNVMDEKFGEPVKTTHLLHGLLNNQNIMGLRVAKSMLALMIAASVVLTINCRWFKLFHQGRNSYTAPIANGCVRKIDVSMQVDEFPERPGQPECDYFMKTGDCKFKSTCRFHHPKNRIPKVEECILNENGLPLRPATLGGGQGMVEAFVGIMSVMVFASLDVHACLTTQQPMDCQHIQNGPPQHLLLAAMVVAGIIKFT
ncbi:Zinc finger CCCH domain-containing protein 67 [Sesamum angolense]|uniref:Zinc finger CCCH domain-containing protein 67 n=1 Tax=Sesamum angolense TaxID=2727404 RepID=A0AAE1WGM1_9LAMI|nr:Zinc finger CCCH domain-containing protein 67 [Sesamum angolense]